MLLQKDVKVTKPAKEKYYRFKHINQGIEAAAGPEVHYFKEGVNYLIDDLDNSNLCPKEVKMLPTEIK